MIQITIRDLHMKTGDWVRKAAESDGIIVMDRRRPVAKLVSFSPDEERKTFAQRRILKEFAELPMTTDDSTRYISEDRERL